MLHYEYKFNNDNELKLLKTHTEIDYEDNFTIVFSLTKKQLRNIKLKVLESNRDFTLLKRIIFNSKIIRHDELYEKLLTKDLSEQLSKEIDNHIMKELIKKGKIDKDKL